MNPFSFKDQPSVQAIKQAMEGFGAWLEIDLDAISFNLEQVRSRVGAGVEVIPVMKNDAYGHGLVPMVAHLNGQGCRRVMVAKLYEALALRRALPECEVVCMDTVHTETQAQQVVETDIIPIIYDLDVAMRLAAAAGRQSKTARVFLKIDTGMHRVGVACNHAPQMLDDLRAMDNIEVLAVMSTFMQDPEHDAMLLERFVATCKQAGISGKDGVLRSMGSTNSIFHLENSALEFVRPAMCLFGVFPFEGDRECGMELRQALTMYARLELVKTIERGDSVSYFGSFTAPKRMRVGTLHAGFFDGIPREVANKAIYRFGDTDCAAIGSISLNHTLVDLSETDARVGDIITLIGREGECDLNALAGRAGWMVYSVLNHLNLLLPRIYTKAGKPVALLDRAASLYGI